MKSRCSSKPSLVEYLSYNVNFLSVLVGPCSSYKDYVEFIEGRHIRARLSLANGKQSGQDSWPEPSPMVGQGPVNSVKWLNGSC